MCICVMEHVHVINFRHLHYIYSDSYSLSELKCVSLLKVEIKV